MGTKKKKKKVTVNDMVGLKRVGSGVKDLLKPHIQQ